MWSVRYIFLCINPFVFVELFKKKSSYNLICFLILFICSIIQLSIILISTSIVENPETNTAVILEFSKYEPISFYIILL